MFAKKLETRCINIRLNYQCEIIKELEERLGIMSKRLDGVEHPNGRVFDYHNRPWTFFYKGKEYELKGFLGTIYKNHKVDDTVLRVTCKNEHGFVETKTYAIAKNELVSLK